MLVALLPVSALVLYVTLGNPNAIRGAVQASERAPMSHEQLTTMVDKLAARMKGKPEDPTGWKLLARAYSAMGRYEESVAAFSRSVGAIAAGGSGAAGRLGRRAGDAKTDAAGRASQLVTRALALDPRNQKALSLSASAALERKDYDAAITEWRKLQAQFAPASAEAKEIASMIAQADAAKRGGAGAAGAPSVAAARRECNGAVATGYGATSSRVDASTVTRARLARSQAARPRCGRRCAVRICARGRRLADAARGNSHKANELPRSFTLDDSMAMSPAAQLSSAADVVVEARVSKSGSATPAPGDLRGASGQIRPGGDEVSIVIDGVLP